VSRQNVRRGWRAREWRQIGAQGRAVAYARRSDVEQLALLDARRGESARERERLDVTVSPPVGLASQRAAHKGRACDSKVRYGERRAKRAARKLRDEGDEVHAYHCSDHWHVGDAESRLAGDAA
jgi:hypothetical protein